MALVDFGARIFLARLWQKFITFMINFLLYTFGNSYCVQVYFILAGNFVFYIDRISEGALPVVASIHATTPPDIFSKLSYNKHSHMTACFSKERGNLKSLRM